MKYFIALLISVNTFAAVPEFLKNMSGCFKISYRFLDGTGKFHAAASVEWIDLREEKDVIELHHLAPWGGHFYEEWTLKGNKYVQRVLSFKDTAVRYTCESGIDHNQLRCLAPKATKPVRDEKRTDYEYLNRENTIQISKTHWVQSEINNKMTKDGKLVTKEVGWVEYTRADEKVCGLIKR